MTESTPLLLRSPWTQALSTLLAHARSELLIACPYVTRFGVERILAGLTRRETTKRLSFQLITDLSPESVMVGSLDLDAINVLAQQIPGFQLTHLPSIHAKVYVADARMAILTSGNLTASGLLRNVEYGIALETEQVVSEIRSDFLNYGRLGAAIPANEIAELSDSMRTLVKSFRQAQENIAADRLMPGPARQMRNNFLETFAIQRHSISPGLNVIRLTHPIVARSYRASSDARRVRVFR